MTRRSLLALAVATLVPSCHAAPPDPASWGGDHVGRPLPEYVTGDECLFCHRADVGPRWYENRHNLTVRPAEPGAPRGATHAMGRSRLRLLRTGKGYGRLEFLADDGWDLRSFGDSCAGCHATAVDSKTRTFSAISIECFSCHGDLPLEHSTKPGTALFGKARAEPARVLASTCAQCHVRTGRSASTGLPYPNHFVPGDNLFRDFEADFSIEALARLNPADRHIQENVRDVALLGREGVTCLSCHDVHAESTRRHRTLPDGPICWNCHHEKGSKKRRKDYEVHSAACGY